MVGVWAFLAGAKRWWNADLFKALGTVLAVLIVCLFVAAMWGKAETAGGAKRDASWMQRVNAGLAKVYKVRAEKAQIAALAADQQRERLEAERDEAVARAAAVAAELSKLTDDPIVFPKSLAREMRR